MTLTSDMQTIFLIRCYHYDGAERQMVLRHFLKSDEYERDEA